MTQTRGVGAWISSTPFGSLPFHPGAAMANWRALPPVVRVPTTANTSVHMSSIGTR